MDLGLVFLHLDLEHPVFQLLGEDSQFLVAGAQHPGTLDHHGTDADGGPLADDLHGAADDLPHLAECCLEIAAALVTLGPCRSAGSLFEFHYYGSGRNLLTSSSHLAKVENIGPQGGPGARSCRTAGCLGACSGRCGG